MPVLTTLKKTPICLAIGSVMLSLHGASALAQNAPTDEVEIISVRATSFADSLAKALMDKKLATGAVDTILAEDIADFPDQNLAESLQRIPGVAVTREAGEGREITVRGLNSTFTRVQLNGMEAQSLAAGTGGVQTNRGFDFNVFASELFSQLSVYKTTSAELEEGSLGATVGLRTGRPFDFNDNTSVVNVQGAYNDQSSEFTPRMSGLTTYTNDDQTFGVLVSAAYSDRNINNVGADTGRWEDDTFGACSACSSDEEASATSKYWHPRFPRMSDKTHDQQRLGLTASVQFLPSDATEITVDVLYSNITSVRDEPFMEAISLARTNSTGVGQSDIAAYEVDGNGTMYAATIADVDVRSEFFIAEWESKFTQFSVNVEHDFSENLHGSVLVGSSKSTLDNRETTVVYEHFSDNDNRKLVAYADASSTVSYDFSDMLNPQIGYSFDTTNPANWEMSEWRDRIYDAESSADNARLDLDYALSDVVTLRTGATYKKYAYQIAGTRADAALTSADSVDGTVDGVACGIGSELTSANGNIASFGDQHFFIANQDQFARFRQSGCWPDKVQASDTRAVEEKSLGYFVQADFNLDIGESVLRGNAGVRHVKTELSSTGLQNGTIEVTVDNDYSDTLPSINLAYDVSDDVILRASWSKVMSRPNLTTLNPGGSVSIFGDLKVSYGNPFIEPFRATAYDLSAEWYFAEGALLSMAYFKKDIESFPTSQTTILPWSEVGLPDSVLGSEVNNIKDADFTVSRTVNGEGGKLDGFEIQYQQPLTFLPGPEWLQKFGVMANMTFVDSEVTYGADRIGPLTGQSKHSSNFTLYWEDDVFSARISLAKRGYFYSDYSSSDAKKLRFVDDTTFVDMSASYKFSDKLKVTLEGLNLTDESIAEYMDKSAPRIISEQNTGRIFFLGASYSF